MICAITIFHMLLWCSSCSFRFRIVAVVSVLCMQNSETLENVMKINNKVTFCINLTICGSCKLFAYVVFKAVL